MGRGGISEALTNTSSTPVSVTYSYTVTAGGCTGTSNVVVTVNNEPAPITGNGVLCVGTNTTLSNSSGGAWSSSPMSVALVNSSGVVTGMSTGTATISFTLFTGCFTTAVVTVNPALNAGTITGSSTVDVGTSITLTDIVSGGVWSAGNPNATVNGLGVVTGVTAGNTTISYSVTNVCGTIVATKLVTVNPASLPPITGTFTVCTGQSTTLSDATPGGVWNTSNGAIAYISATGVVTGMAAGTATISYSLSGMMATRIVTVNPSPAAITGTAAMCAGSSVTLACATAGGTWSSAAGATVGSTGIVTGLTPGITTITYTLSTGCIATKAVTVNGAPGAITGATTTCIGATTTLGNSALGGVWSSTATSIVSVGSASGIITGLASGAATITYTLSGGCKTTIAFSVNPSPANITGAQKACPGTTTTLADATAGGTWGSSNTSVATVGATTGIVTGVSAGVVTISYFTAAGCYKTLAVTINPTPAPIAGTGSICTGATTTLSDPSGAGLSWTSSNAVVATVNATSGVVTGVTAGTSEITFTLATGCKITSVVTINNLPTAISGTLTVCAGATTSLASGGGTWSSVTPTVASIGSGTGIVSGLVGGTSRITYSEGPGCFRTAVVTVNVLPAAIGGTGVACVGTTTTLTNTFGTTGTWSSSNISIATIGVWQWYYDRRSTWYCNCYLHDTCWLYCYPGGNG